MNRSSKLSKTANAKTNKKNSWQLIDHTADTGVRIHANTLEGLFATAVDATTQLMFGKICGAKTAANKKIKLKGQDDADLLVRFINEIIYIADVEKRPVVRANIQSLESHSIRATLELGDATPLKQQLKAATYHQLQLEHEGGEWSVQIIFDV